MNLFFLYLFIFKFTLLKKRNMNKFYFHFFQSFSSFLFFFCYFRDKYIKVHRIGLYFSSHLSLHSAYLGTTYFSPHIILVMPMGCVRLLNKNIGQASLVHITMWVKLGRPTFSMDIANVGQVGLVRPILDHQTDSVYFDLYQDNYNK